MITVTNRLDIGAAVRNFVPDSGGASATGRLLPGQWESENCQEWAEHGTLNGVPAKVYYIFENSECESGDGGDYPWDADHVTKIQVAEKDGDGDFELL